MKNAKVGINGIFFLISDRVATPPKSIKTTQSPICVSLNNINI